MSQRTARRIKQKKYGASVQTVDGVPATTVNTADEILRLHKLDTSETRRQARLGKPTDRSSGSVR